MPPNPLRPDRTVPATDNALRAAQKEYAAALGQAQAAYARALDVAARLDEPIELPVLDWQPATAAGTILAAATAPTPPPPKRHVRCANGAEMWLDERQAREAMRDFGAVLIDELEPLEPAKEFQQHGERQYATAPTTQAPRSTVRPGQLINGPQ